MADQHPFWDQLERWKAEQRERNTRETPAERKAATLNARAKFQAIMADLEAKLGA